MVFCRLLDSKVSQFKREELQFYWPPLASCQWKEVWQLNRNERRRPLPNPTLRRWKPVGGRENSGAVRLVVGKPGFHRHEAGWGTLDSVQQTVRSRIQIFNSSHSIKTKFGIPSLSTDWIDRSPSFCPHHSAIRHAGSSSRLTNPSRTETVIRLVE